MAPRTLDPSGSPFFTAHSQRYATAQLGKP
jgi:hypothetical protein